MGNKLWYLRSSDNCGSSWKISPVIYSSRPSCSLTCLRFSYTTQIWHSVQRWHPGFKKASVKIKLPPVRIVLRTLTITGSEVWCLSLLLICDALPVSDYQTIIKLCSLELRNDPSPKSELVHEAKFSCKISYLTQIWLAQLDKHQISKPVMVSVVSSILIGGNFIICWNILKSPGGQYYTKMPELSNFC